MIFCGNHKSIIIFAICYVLPRVYSIAIAEGYIYNNCTGTGRFNFKAVTGGVLYWDERTAFVNGTGAGEMNNTNIIDCSITFNGRPQGENNGYMQFLTFHWRSWVFDPQALTRQTEATTYLNDTLQQITDKCGSSCPTGCLIFINPRSGAQRPYCGGDNLQGSDHTEMYTETSIQWRFYLLGSYYENVNGTDETRVQKPEMNIIIDYTSFFAGPCYTTSQYQCPKTGRCIDIDLHCDNKSAVNCGLPKSGTIGDRLNCDGSTPPTDTPFDWEPLLLAAVVLSSLLTAVMLFLWLFWRPGYLLWRCARVRNCRLTASCVNACCRRPYTHGACSPSGSCSACCGQTGATAFVGSGCAVCLCPGIGGGCGGASGGGGAGGGGAGGAGGYYGNANGNPFKDHGNGGFKGDFEPGFEWTKWHFDDGMHLREGR